MKNWSKDDFQEWCVAEYADIAKIPTTPEFGDRVMVLSDTNNSDKPSIYVRGASAWVCIWVASV